MPQAGGAAAQSSVEQGVQNGMPAVQSPFAPLASGPQGTGWRWCATVSSSLKLLPKTAFVRCVYHTMTHRTALHLKWVVAPQAIHHTTRVQYLMCSNRWPAVWLGCSAGHAVPHNLLLQRLDRRAHLAAPRHTGSAAAADRLGRGHRPALRHCILLRCQHWRAAVAATRR